MAGAIGMAPESGFCWRGLGAKASGIGQAEARMRAGANARGPTLGARWWQGMVLAAVKRV